MRAAALLLLAVSLPAAEWPRATLEQAGLDVGALNEARDFALRGGGAGFILRSGKAVYAWGDTRERFDLKSTSKSIGGTALALALADGKVSLDSLASDCLPDFATPPGSNLETGWARKITLYHLATHTAGFAKPGGFEALEFEPGTAWRYSDGGPNWLADCLTRVYGRDLEDLLFERVFTPIGITRDDLRWRDNQYRPHEMDVETGSVKRREFGSGVHASVEAMARLGELYRLGGMWEGERLLPADYVERLARPQAALLGLPVHDAERYPGASDHYGILWWTNGDGALKGVPADAYWSWGLYDSLIVVIPSLKLVVARAGPRGGFQGEGWEAGYERLAAFLRPIVDATGPAPPPSPVIESLDWSPASTIVRKAPGSDNWPITWGDDDALYTAYGDGWGFEPKVEKKLSLGLARVLGPPDDFHGENLRSDSGETIGQGEAGLKASGILMVDGVLYLWMRNAGNAVLNWSADHGKNWDRADWKLTESFGAPSFLNFGRDYEGAPDEYVYVFSHDSDSAYHTAAGLVLARAPKNRLRDKASYEYFAGAGRWSSDPAGRRPVLVNPGRVYRTQVSYNAGLGRYLACVVTGGPDTRFEGGFSVFDAPAPWGPWTTAYSTRRWDVGPGETCGFPTKWMSADGLTLHLVFSGDDAFALRQARIRLR